MISVVVPVYNGKDEILKCIDALKGQNFKGKKEIIIVDDGSTDGTSDILKNIKGVRVVTQSNMGPAAARNVGIKKSKGNIILFTDSDCKPEKNWIKEIVKTFEDKDVMGVQGVYKSNQKSLMARFTQIEIEGRYQRMARFKKIDFIGTYSAGYRKRVFDDIGGFDESFLTASGEDTELSFRMAEKGWKMMLNMNAIVYHNHPEGISEYLKIKFFRAYWRVLLYKKHKNKIIKETYTPQGLKIQIGLFYGFFAFMLISLLFDWIIFVGLGFYALLLMSTIPASYSAFKKDKIIGLISLVVLQLRSIVFGLGMLEGFLKGVWKR